MGKKRETKKDDEEEYNSNTHFEKYKRKCNWCGKPCLPAAPGKRYCSSCARACFRECTTCGRPFDSPKFFTLAENRCDTCHRKVEAAREARAKKQMAQQKLASSETFAESEQKNKRELFFAPRINKQANGGENAKRKREADSNNVTAERGAKRQRSYCAKSPPHVSPLVLNVYFNGIPGSVTCCDQREQQQQQHDEKTKKMNNTDKNPAPSRLKQPSPRHTITISDDNDDDNDDDDDDDDKNTNDADEDDSGSSSNESCSEEEEEESADE